VSNSLRWTIVPGAERTEIALAGSLDEWADMDALFDQLPSRSSTLALDLSQVKRISSVGVRVWITFIEKLKQYDIPFEMHGCSVVIVRQLNMISQFRGHGKVCSAYAPYYCAKCVKEQLRLIDLETDVTAQLRESMPCPTCGTMIELDEEEELYTELQA
jgi:ABC-type transporter Mla MlaB component/DNA-directed RNA polymerase subunit RPC12/RpoP